MYIFYAPHIEEQSMLPEEEAIHCIRVLRQKVGDKIKITDGKGNFFDAQIIETKAKQCTVKIETKEHWEKTWNFNLHLAIAPTKNIDRIEWLIEKATELGIDTLTPLLCRYSERKELKTNRLEKILVAAMKQSQKAQLPRLNPMTNIAEFLKQPHTAQKYIAHCYPGDKKYLKNITHPGKDVIILIGPEGDFSPEEIEEAYKAGYAPITLGNARLRTETAALFACSTLHVINQK